MYLRQWEGAQLPNCKDERSEGVGREGTGLHCEGIVVSVGAVSQEMIGELKTMSTGLSFLTLSILASYSY